MNKSLSRGVWTIGLTCVGGLALLSPVIADEAVATTTTPTTTTTATATATVAAIATATTTNAASAPVVIS